MSQQQQSFTYHSLHRHYEAKQNPTVYSSNKQPQLPSILQRSRQKKSHEKSLKKGISRVSKSKKDLLGENNVLLQGSKQVESGRTLLSKGTLLNFNLQEVVENKYHLAKPKDELVGKSPLYIKIKKQQGHVQRSQQQYQQRQQYQNQHSSFINQYKVVTYVPQGYLQQQNMNKYGYKQNDNNQQQISKQLIWGDKENNLNESNLQIRKSSYINNNNNNNNNHKKNDSQQVYIRNPIQDQHVLELDTWRTNTVEENINNNDNNNTYYYANNYRTQQQVTTNNYRAQFYQKNVSQYVPSTFQQRYSIPLTVNDIEQIAHDSNRQNVVGEEQQLRQKIRHLEHQIVDIERQKSQLKRENDGLREENMKATKEYTMGQQKIQEMYQSLNTMQKKIKYQQQQIRTYQQQQNISASNNNNNNNNKLSQSQLYQQQPKQYQSSSSSSSTNILRKRIQQLQLANAGLSRELSQKSVVINQFKRGNNQLSERIREIQRVVKQKEERLDQYKEQLQKKQHTINRLQKKIDQINEGINKNNTNSNIGNNNSKYYSLNKPKQQQQQTLNQNNTHHQIQQLQQKLQQQTRDYKHLLKKHDFMKDQLQHFKYLHNNGSSSYRSGAGKGGNNNSKNLAIKYEGSSDKYKNTNLLSQKHQQQQQYITEIETQLQLTTRELQQISAQYSNIKLNFRSLQQLYIKQQQQLQQIQNQLFQCQKQNKRIKIQLTNNLQEINNAKILKLNKQSNQSLALIQKQEVIISLKRQLNALEIQKFQILDNRDYLQTQLENLNKSYLKEIEKNTNYSIRYKEDIQTFTEDVQKQQQQKTSLIVMNYQTLITKLNQQITILKQQVSSIKEKNHKQLIKLEDIHKDQLQRIKNQQYSRQNKILKENQSQDNRVRLQDRMSLEKSQIRRMDVSLNEEIAARKQLQRLNTRLEQECATLEGKYKKLSIQKVRLEDDLTQNLRKVSNYAQDIDYYKSELDNITREKQQLSNQLQRVNTQVTQLKKGNSLFEQQRFMFNRQIDELSAKYAVCLKDNECFVDEIKAIKKRLAQKKFQVDNCEANLREIRIQLLQQKQLTQKRFNMIESIKLQSDTYRSNQQYYKVLCEKINKQLQLSKQQNALLSLQNQKASLQLLNSSPIKRLSPVKNSASLFNKNSDHIVVDDMMVKDRQTQLYRIEIYKDLNVLLNLTLQNFTLQQVLEKNQQEYLRKLFNAIKQDHTKLIELKQLIVDMEESFKDEKVHIKRDYDLVYEKYLKYKSMCQAMEKDIEKYRLKIKIKDENFVSIHI